MSKNVKLLIKCFKDVKNVTKVYKKIVELETVSIAEPLQNRQHAQNP